MTQRCTLITGSAMKKKVLILCPPPFAKGGVADYNRLLATYFSSDRLTLEFHYTGDMIGATGIVKKIYKTLFDLIDLVGKLPYYDLVVLNPSLDLKAVLRDGAFHFCAKTVFRRKTVVFFHGWRPEFEDVIDRYCCTLFRHFFNFDKGLVLASLFRSTLVKWGYESSRVGVETTLYEHQPRVISNDRFKILFLSRFTEGKGCLEAIKTVELLAADFPSVRLYMAGEGELTPVLKEYVARHDLADHVEFTGWLQGEEKSRLLGQCGTMLFPTFYGEGLPISLVEGMGAGMAVVTRPAGGIPDAIEDGENGFVVPSDDPADFARKIKLLLDDAEIWQRMSKNNLAKSAETFEVRKVIQRLERIYYDTACGVPHAP